MPLEQARDKSLLTISLLPPMSAHILGLEYMVTEGAPHVPYKAIENCCLDSKPTIHLCLGC